MTMLLTSNCFGSKLGAWDCPKRCMAGLSGYGDAILSCHPFTQVSISCNRTVRGMCSQKS